MTDDKTQSRPRMVQDAEADSNGEPIYEYEAEVAPGATKTVEINVRRVFSPGERRTGNHDILQIEAKLADDGVELGNAAKPVDGEVAEQHAEWCDRNDLRPAWDVCDREEWSI